MAKKIVFGLFVVVAISLGGLAEDGSSSSSLLLQPETLVESKLGKVLAWHENGEALRKIISIELQSGAFLLPMYNDVDSMCYVSQGRARAGIIDPYGRASNIRYVRIGDMVMIPAGWPIWLWNTAISKLGMFCVQHTTSSHNTFFLAGGSNETQHGSSILHGFSDSVLKEMWGSKKDEIHDIINANDDTIFTKAAAEFESNAYEGDLALNMLLARPLEIEEGGSITVLDSSKMRALKNSNFGALLVKLNSESMFLPQWELNGGQVIYITKGCGRIEVSSNNGKQLLGDVVNKGDVISVPPFHPYVVVNNASFPLEWICIYSSSRFIPSFLAGSRSVYKSIPKEYLAASFNVTVRDIMWLREARHKNEFFFKLR